jgi:hypothetical protein
MAGIDLFDLNKPSDLYKIIHEVYLEFIEQPTERNFLMLTLGFTHLREWIAESNHVDIEKKLRAGDTLSAGEAFFTEIYAIPEFRTIQELSNRGKHHIIKNTVAQTSKKYGLQVRIAKAGDRLNQTYFLIDGRDSRDYFIPLIHKYNEWFAHDDA